MAEVLSQEEIDSLLSALSTGVVSADKVKSEQQETVKLYDFKRPDRVSKDQLRTLDMIHESFARLFATYLSGYLRTMVHIKVVSVDQLTYGEFIRSIPSPTSLNILSMHPLEGKAILEINPALCFGIIDRLLGGLGLPGEQIREFTDIEQTIVNKVIDRALDSLKVAWENIAALAFKVEAWESNPQFAQIVSPSEMIILITFEIVIGEHSGMMSLCVPYVTIEPIIHKLSAHLWFSAVKKQSSDEVRDLIVDHLGKVEVKITANLSAAQINVRDFLMLKRGDVIKLDNDVNDPVLILVEDKPKLLGSPGKVKKSWAVKIKQVIGE